MKRVRVTTPEDGLVRILEYIRSDHNRIVGARRAYDTLDVLYNRDQRLYQVWLGDFGASKDHRETLKKLLLDVDVRHDARSTRSSFELGGDQTAH